LLAQQQPMKCCRLVLAHLAAEAGAGAVADIFKRGRARHGQWAITGVMLFDGERLGALLCGAQPQVALAAEALLTDLRLRAPWVLAEASEPPPWLAPAWRSGWCEPDALAALAALGIASAPEGDAAIQAWQALIAASDLL
jgi:hypothetical protein